MGTFSFKTFTLNVNLKIKAITTSKKNVEEK